MVQQIVTMVVAGCGAAGCDHGGSGLWCSRFRSWWQQVVVQLDVVQQVVVMVAAGCGHGGSRLWSWWQQVVVMAAAGCGHGGSRLWS